MGEPLLQDLNFLNYTLNSNYDNAVGFNLSLVSSGALYIRDTSGFAYDTISDRITAFNNQEASVTYKFFKSPDYTSSAIPADKVTALQAHVRTSGRLASTASATTGPNDDVTLTGSGTTNMFAFPIIAIPKTVLANMMLQILDAFDRTIDPQPLGEFTASSTDYQVYFIDQALTKDESIEIKIQVG